MYTYLKDLLKLSRTSGTNINRKRFTNNFFSKVNTDGLDNGFFCGKVNEVVI